MKSFALVVLVALAAAGVSSASSTPLRGSFQATVKSKVAQLDGRWVLSFSPNGAYRVSRKPSTMTLIGGKSTVSGHTIVFLDKTGPLACLGGQARATYSWSLSGKTLRFKPLKEPCAGRKMVLSTAPFTRIR